jgi:hypothetical protein
METILSKWLLCIFHFSNMLMLIILTSYIHYYSSIYYNYIWLKFRCVGMNENGGVTPTENDTGLYSLFS